MVSNMESLEAVAWGAEPTVMVLYAVSELKQFVETIMMVFEPEEVYKWVGFVEVDVLPSPKSQYELPEFVEVFTNWMGVLKLILVEVDVKLAEGAVVPPVVQLNWNPDAVPE